MLELKQYDIKIISGDPTWSLLKRKHLSNIFLRRQYGKIALYG